MRVIPFERRRLAEGRAGVFRIRYRPFTNAVTTTVICTLASGSVAVEIPSVR